MGSKKQSIAVIIDTDWPLKRHHEVIVGIQDFAAEHNSNWEVINDLYPERIIEQYDGVIGRITADLAIEAAKANIPVVNVWYSSPVADDMPSVLPDFVAAGQLAADHLIARGFQNFGFIGYSNPGNRYMRDSFIAYLKKPGFNCSPLLVSEGYNADREAWDRFSTQLEEWSDNWTTPIGIYCQDSLSNHLVTICNRRQISIPQEVALMSNHNEPGFCLLSHPTISSIDLGYHQVGFQAAQLLNDLLHGAQEPKQPILLPPAFLEVRESTDAYVVKNPVTSAALRFIAGNSHHPIKVDDVAQGVSVSRRTLERCFQETGRRTISNEILHFRVERLKRLLVQTDSPVKELSYAAGFTNPGSMNKAFTRVTGTTPLNYRKEHGQNRWVEQ